MEVSKTKVQELVKLLGYANQELSEYARIKMQAGDKNAHKPLELARRLCNQRRYYERLLNYHNNK